MCILTRYRIIAIKQRMQTHGTTDEYLAQQFLGYLRLFYYRCLLSHLSGNILDEVTHKTFGIAETKTENKRCHMLHTSHSRQYACQQQ